MQIDRCSPTTSHRILVATWVQHLPHAKCEPLSLSLPTKLVESPAGVCAIRLGCILWNFNEFYHSCFSSGINAVIPIEYMMQILLKNVLSE
jgi:hypothetical protein